MLDSTQLMYRKAMEGGNSVDSDSMVNHPEKLRHIMDLKTYCTGNARLLYGSEQRKFFDVVNAISNGQYAAVLVCSQDGASKILRKEVGSCPLLATQALVDGLLKDTGLLFEKYDVGDQIQDQQGYRNDDGKWELDEYKDAVRDSGPVDDTKTLRRQWNDVPRGPRGGLNSKRVRSVYD